MRTKDDSVNITDLRDEISAALPQIESVHAELSDGEELVITSGRDGKHSVKRSAHYRGDAVDLRVWYVESSAEFAEHLADVLGEDFVVLDEGNHVHVHWGPVWKS